MEVLASRALPQDEQGCDEGRDPDGKGRENDVRADRERALQTREQYGGDRSVHLAGERAIVASTGCTRNTIALAYVHLAPAGRSADSMGSLKSLNYLAFTGPEPSNFTRF
jgi:hypothetical protein